MANYRYRTTFTDQRGKRHEVYANKLKDLEDKKRKAQEKYNSDTMFIDNANLTLNQYYDEWAADRLAKNIIKESSFVTTNAKYNKHIRPDIGEMKIQSISQRQVENFQRRLLEKDGMTLKSCQSVMKLLKTTLKNATKSKVIKEDPSRDIDVVKPKTTKKATETYHRALTREEQALFMAELKGDFYYEFIALMISTGMRCGEVAALTYKDIDLKKGVIHITKTATRGKDYKRVVGETPKTDSSNRDIFTNPKVEEIIRSQAAKNEIISISNGDTFFKSPKGNIISDWVINKAIARTLKKIKKSKGIEIEPFTSHALRDTYATRFLEQEKDLKTLQKILGHKNFSMTADLYAHVIDDTKQEAMKRVIIDVG